MAERILGRRSVGSRGRILERAASGRGDFGTTDRLSETCHAQLSRSQRESRDRQYIKRSSEETQSARRGDIVHGVDGRLQGSPDEVQRGRGSQRRNTDRE